MGYPFSSGGGGGGLCGLEKTNGGVCKARMSSMGCPLPAISAIDDTMNHSRHILTELYL